MNILSFAKSLLRLKTQKADRLFTYPRDKQERYLQNLYDKYLKSYDGKKTFTEYETRSFCQYLAQRELDGKIIFFITEIASFFIYPILKYKYLRNYKKRIKNHSSDKNATNISEVKEGNNSSNKDFAVYLVYDADKSNFPHELNDIYNHTFYNNYNYSELTSADLKFLAQVNAGHRFDFSYKLKILIKVAIYRAMIESFPKDLIKAVIVCSEYSYTSSVLSYYLKEQKIKHINIMHGEKLYYMRDSFCLFSQLWVWDEHYKDLFESLYVPSYSIKVHNMTEFKWKNLNAIQSELSDFSNTAKWDYCYYLANESKEELELIKQALDKLIKNSSETYKIRLHPRYTDKDLVYSLFDEEHIEAEGLSILDSLKSCHKAISLYSTVLYQAYELGNVLIIDDIKNPAYYRVLQDLSYIIFSKKHDLLSELIRDKEK